ncbi:MAG: class I SAM-dependent methyltransferase [Desulfobacter sp.]|nr:MAG: class I SAM-dependent methyltransferase [Desulfobacter sp.]
MKPLDYCDLADLTINMTWTENQVTHNDLYFANRLNLYRDIFPGSLLETVLRYSGTQAPFFLSAQPGEIVPGFDPELVLDLPLSRVRQEVHRGAVLPGRYYPRGMLRGVPGVFRENRLPSRVTNVCKGRMTIDLNHPLAREAIDLRLDFSNRDTGTEERGGTCTDWLGLALDGPGMQVGGIVLSGEATLGRRFKRKDDAPDSLFYDIDRFVYHIDTMASRNLCLIYESLLSDGDRVLDLMSGWVSHLPEEIRFSEVRGLGMNPNEMNDNPILTAADVHDLNEDPLLPYESGRFDAVVCSLSVEYLVRPDMVFKEVARVLRPGGRFVVGFSNRWFPQKAITVWEELHEFERVGLVLDWFKASECFTRLVTYSVRGYPRPADDKYFPGMVASDPVFVVTGKSNWRR